MCASIYLPHISLSPCLFVFAFWSIFADLFRNTPYILYLSTFLHILSLQPYTHLHIYQSFYVSTYMYLFPYESTYLCFLSSSMFINICLSIYLFIDLHIYPIRSKKSTKHKLCNLIQSKLFLSQFHYQLNLIYNSYRTIKQHIIDSIYLPKMWLSTYHLSSNLIYYIYLSVDPAVHRSVCVSTFPLLSCPVPSCPICLFVHVTCVSI